MSLLTPTTGRRPDRRPGRRPDRRPEGRPGSRLERRAPAAGLARLDPVLMAAVLALCVASALLVWSATAPRAALTGGDPTAFLERQVVNIVIGLGLMVTVAALDHRWVRILTPALYLASVVGLVLVLVAGSTINGSQSWLRVGGLSVQPSELAKLAVVVAMALVVAERTESRGRGRGAVRAVEVLLMLAIAAVPAALILAQPEIGRAHV